MRSTIGTKFLRTLIAAGYLLMCLLAVGIMYLWFYEWKEIEALETENRRIWKIQCKLPPKTKRFCPLVLK